MKVFFEKTDEAIALLCELDKKVDDLASPFYGDTFADQKEIAISIENKMQIISHETASYLAFMKQDLKDILCFFEFRKRYSFHTDETLSRIVDSVDLTLSFKMNLKTLIVDKTVTEFTHDVRRDWNNLFSLQSYNKIREKIK